MATINLLKQQSETDTPVLLFECSLINGDVERWCTHGLLFNGSAFESRVISHNLFDLQLASDDAMDGLSRLSLVLANADSVLSEINAAIGFKGAQLCVYFAFADLPSMQTVSESSVLFRGVAGDPEEVTEDSLTLTFTNKLSLQRIALPETRVQRTCPWNFPSSAAQRLDGVSTRYSPFEKCGYSPDISGGVGNLDQNGNPYTQCDKTRTQCQQRGMFDVDQTSTTRRFGGIEFVPSAISVRTSGDKTTHISPLLVNEAKFNDAIPAIYGTGWLKAPIVFARNDGNLTHIEVLLGSGEINEVLKVVVNDVEIPLVVGGKDMTATGWYEVFSTGKKTGAFNYDFLDAHGVPLGDPYGSIAAMSVIVPNRIASGSSLPTAQVLLQGVKVQQFDANGQLVTEDFSNNPAWIILDILRRCGWKLPELNLQSFYRSAQFCQELISTTDIHGNVVATPRFQCNLVLSKRQSAATVIRGIRVAASLMLRYGFNGLLELLPEAALSTQQPEPVDGSNSTDPLDSGWPAYEFCDGSASFSGIVRLPSGSSSVRLLANTIAESSNRLSVEFQDEQSEYQQDSLSIVNGEDSALIGYEIASQSVALGLPNYNQATRVLLRQLDKTLKGNLFVEFQTSFRALKVRPGDIITLTYLKEGFERIPFRVTKLSPSVNFQVLRITAQIHNDDWYSDDIDVLATAGRQPHAGISTPRPLIGLVAKNSPTGAVSFDFLVTEEVQELNDGSAMDLLTLGFATPRHPDTAAIRIPLLSFSTGITSDNGTLPGNHSFYYAVSTSVGDMEGPLSFTVRANTPPGSDSNQVTINELSFPTNATGFNVYRGDSPQMLYQIASAQAITSTFTDPGLSIKPIPPPDASFDHANFYYRTELAGPFLVSTATANTVTCADLGATPGAYGTALVRIVSGMGAGQERIVQQNDATTLTLQSNWVVTPDVTSEFVLCEPSWHFAGITQSSPVQFSIPYRAKTVIQVCGRAANIHNLESAIELSPLTRIVLGSTKPDFGIPAVPTFTLQAPGGGQVSLSEVGFSSDSNVANVASGTLLLYFVDELAAAVGTSTIAADPSTGEIYAVAQLQAKAGSFLLVDSEAMYVVSIDPTNGALSVLRGQLGTIAQSHLAGAPIVVLQMKTHILPFAPGMFENRASVNLVHTMSLPDARIVAAEFSVSNGFGQSQGQLQTFVENGNSGLRTLSGGQLSLQVAGYLATQVNSTPPLTIETSHAIRDIRAVLGQAATGFDLSVSIFRNGSLLCALLIAAGDSASQLIDGLQLPSLLKDDLLTTAVALQPTTPAATQPVPPRDITVTIRF